MITLTYYNWKSGFSGHKQVFHKHSDRWSFKLYSYTVYRVESLWLYQTSWVVSVWSRSLCHMFKHLRLSKMIPPLSILL